MAEGWLTQGVSKEPRPAELHSEYITFSRATVAGWQKLMISSVAVAVILLSGLSVFSFLQRQQAVKQKLVAEQQRTEADKQRLRAEEIARIAMAQSLAATASMNLETDPELSLLLATKSIRIMSEVNETVLPLSNTVLRQSIIKSRVRLTLKGHDSKVLSAAYSPDGQRIVTASLDRTAKVWETQTGKEMFTLTGHNDYVMSAGYSPDGQRVVTASRDNTAKVWEAQTGKEMLTLTGHNGNVSAAVYSPDGQRIVTAGADGIVQIYTTDMDELLEIATSRVTRQLTAEEKEMYGVLD